MDDKSPATRYLLHFGSGGLSHMLRCLGNTLQYCQETDKVCVPLLASNRAFGLNFHSIFSSNSNVIADQATCEEFLQSRLSYLGQSLHIAAIRLMYSGDSGAGEYLVSDGKLPWKSHSLHLDRLTSFEPCPATAGTYSSRRHPPGGSWCAALSLCRVAPILAERIRTRLKQLPQQYIGVHYRNTDMRTNFTDVADCLAEQLSKSKLSSVYWATDDIGSLEAAQKRFPDVDIRNLATLIDPRHYGAPSLHYTNERHLKAAGISKLDQVVDALADIYLLAKSTTFVASPQSSLSRLVALLRSNDTLLATFFGSTA
jgi:hypothetical protein